MNKNLRNQNQRCTESQREANFTISQWSSLTFLNTYNQISIREFETLGENQNQINLEIIKNGFSQLEGIALIALPYQDDAPRE